MRMVVQAGLVSLLLAGLVMARGPAFRSQHLLEEHYIRYGKTFGSISREQYLRMAQQLRDAKASKTTLEAKRADGSVLKYDRKRGWFVAYDADGTLRTFFMPTDGLRFFNRQATSPKPPE